MPELGDADDLDLTGTWNGQYSYTQGREPVAFVATLVETGCWLVGSTEERGQVGEAVGRMISATLQGRRTGRSVTFLKIYDGAFRGYDTVSYAGTVNEDGNEIEGRWTIHSSWFGRFLMIRSGGSAVVTGQKAVERI
jgi:hypothetical protein